MIPCCFDGKHVAPVDSFCAKCTVPTCKQCTLTSHYEHIQEVEHRADKLMRLVNVLFTFKHPSAKALQFHSFGIRQNDVTKIVKFQEDSVREEFRKYIGWMRDQKFDMFWKVQLSNYCKSLRSGIDELREEKKEIEELKSNYMGKINQILRTIVSQENKGGVGAASEKAIMKAQKEVKRLRSFQQFAESLTKKIDKIKKIEAKYSTNDIPLSEICQLDATGFTECRLFNFRPESALLTVYYPDIGKSKLVHLFPEFVCPYNYCVAEIKGENPQALILGGTNKNSFGSIIFLNTVYSISYENYAISHYPNFHLPRRKSSACTIANKFIYLVAGDNQLSYIDTCEEFDITQNEWRVIAPLSEPKTNVSLCIFDEVYLYVFGGYNNNGILATIERMDTTLEKKQWELVLPETNTLWDARQSCCTLQISKNEIIVFGGKKAGFTTPQTLIYKIKENIFEISTEMLSSDTFLQSQPKKSGHYIYAIGGHKYDMHIYNTRSKIWNTIAYKEWFPC